jgi:hypothetical protein
VREEHIFRDDGHSGAKLDRPGLDALRDHAARAAFDVVLITAPDRLARNFVHQMVVLEELQRRGVRVVFCDRPCSDDPHEQLVTQIRGAVAEYERVLIADRMRRGRQAANAAWLGLCGIAYNLARWTGRLGVGEARTSTKTLRVPYLALPGRLTVSARRPTLHLPAHWPWQWRWGFALARLRCIPHPI